MENYGLLEWVFYGSKMLQGVLNILGENIFPLNILAKKYLYPVCFEASGYQ